MVFDKFDKEIVLSGEVEESPSVAAEEDTLSAEQESPSETEKIGVETPEEITETEETEEEHSPAENAEHGSGTISEEERETGEDTSLVEEIPIQDDVQLEYES
jgi:hypothetical protein